MKILLLHRDDHALEGPWTDDRWDLIVDLGFAGPGTYRDWARQCGTRVITLHEFAGEMNSFHWIRQALKPGHGYLIDHMGLDWWEILSVLNYHELHTLYLLRELRREVRGSRVEAYASRPGVEAKLFGLVFDCSVPALGPGEAGAISSLRRVIKSARQFPVAQAAEIALDKWDPSYRVRRLVTADRRANLEQAATLLPSAYSNVTRTTLGYAAQFPRRKFLLVTTRRSGVSQRLPNNVKAAPLSAYAVPTAVSESEIAELTNSWKRFEESALRRVEPLDQARQAGVWENFASRLKTAVLIRDAWKCVMETEPLTGVLCADDLNPYTRLPLIIAKQGGLRAVSCHHGALDGGLLFKTSYADIHVVKGEMEKDYVLQTGAIEPDRIVVGVPHSDRVTGEIMAQSEPRHVVFFSQPFEIEGGRVEEIYREILPRLCALARVNGRRLFLKLHPFETRKSRRNLVRRVLSKADVECVDIIHEKSASEILAQTWCGVGVDSTVCVECALKGIPFFLCQWLDFSGLGYLQQFATFGAGTILKSPDEIATVSELMMDRPVNRDGIGRLETGIDAETLEYELFTAQRKHQVAKCG